MLLSTKFGKAVTYQEELPPIKLHNSLTTLSCEILGQTKTIMFPIPNCLWPPNLAE